LIIYVAGTGRFAFSLPLAFAISVERVGTMLIIKTISASASVAAEAIDSFNLEGVAGTIAGDNTIFTVVRTEEKAEELRIEIQKLIK